MWHGKKLAARALPIFLCVMALVLAACNDTNPAPVRKAPADKQVLIMPEAGVADIRTFDPALSTDGPSNTAIDMVFTGLVELNDKGEPQGYLASSWQLSPDHLTYTFHLRSNLKFSDGTALTSADVAYSIDRALQPATKSNTGSYYLKYIKDANKLNAGSIKTIIGDSILTPNASTVIIITSSPVPYFLKALTYPCSYVVEKSLIQKYGNLKFTDHLREGGGDGPFVVAEYTHNQRIVFAPNPYYYGNKPQLRKVIFPFYTGLETAYRAYMAGELSQGFIPISDLTQSKKRSDFHSVSQLWINYYAMNYLTKPFDNIAIRQAFELAVNKDEIVHAAWKDAFIATNHIIPDGMPGHNPVLSGPDGVKTTKGDMVKARQLLQMGMQQEGWTSVSQMPPVILTYSSEGAQATKNEVAILQQQWHDVLGISVIAEDVDFNKLLTEIYGTANAARLQFWGINWIADYPDPEDWTTLQFDKGSSNNNLNYGQNHSTDAALQQQEQQILEQADVEQNLSSRMHTYEQAEQQLVNDVAWMPMEQLAANYLLKPCVVDFVLNHQGLTPPDDWGGIYISTARPCANTAGL